MISHDRPEPSLTVWGVGTPRTLRVHWALQELGCRYLTQPVLPRSEEAGSAAYRAVNPSCKVPALIDGDYVLTESGAIVNYLLRRFGREAGLEPPVEPKRLGRYEEWASLALMELDAASLYVMRRHVDLSAVYGVAPVAVEAALQYAQRAIEALAQRLGADDYAMGASFSGADILVATSLEALRARGAVLPAAVDQYRVRVTARRTYQLALGANAIPVQDALRAPLGTGGAVQGTDTPNLDLARAADDWRLAQP